MPRKYPPLTPKEVISVLKAIGFEFVYDKDDHKVYELGPWHVEVDTGRTTKSGFRHTGMKISIDNAGFRTAPQVFYRATKATAKKVNCTVLSDYELLRIKRQLSKGQPIAEDSLSTY